MKKWIKQKIILPVFLVFTFGGAYLLMTSGMNPILFYFIIFAYACICTYIIDELTDTWK